MEKEEVNDFDHDSILLEGANVIPRRRRVTRACDKCRKKKVKCDGMRPCKNCRLGRAECTFKMPSTRKSSHSPEYLENLESRIRYLENLLRKHSSVDLSTSSPNFLLYLREHKFQAANELELGENHKRLMFQSAIESSGLYNDIATGKRYFRGSTSVFVFVHRLIKNLSSDLEIGNPYVACPMSSRTRRPDYSTPESQFFNFCPRFSLNFLVTSVDPGKVPLPPIEIALQITKTALSNVTDLLFFDCPSDIFSRIKLLYRGDYQTNFLAFFCALLSNGYYHMLQNDPNNLETQGMAKKYNFYSERLVDSIDDYSLDSVQCLLTLSNYRYCRAEIGAGYYYQKLALSCSLKLGLHRNIIVGFTPEQIEARKRVFWVIYCHDRHYATLFGFPLGISDEDIDQLQPKNTSIQFIEGYQVRASDFLFHGIRLYKIVSGILSKLYLIGNRITSKRTVSYMVIIELEQAMDRFYNSLPRSFKTEQPGQVPENRHMYSLMLTYYYFRMLLYRPLLHYLEANSSAMQALKVSERQIAFTLACKCLDSAIVCIQNLDCLTDALIQSNNRYYWTTVFYGFNTILTLMYATLLTKNRNLLVQLTVGRNSLKTLANDWLTRQLIPIMDELLAKLNMELEISEQKKRNENNMGSETFQSPNILEYQKNSSENKSNRAFGNFQEGISPSVNSGNVKSFDNTNLGEVPYKQYMVSDEELVDFLALSSMLNYHTHARKVYHPSFYITRSDAHLDEEAGGEPDVLLYGNNDMSTNEHFPFWDNFLGEDAEQTSEQREGKVENSQSFRPSSTMLDPAMILNQLSHNS
ncbi:membrane-tethered transcription factor [Schizosaccharomyces octosporus yFS286]|uniref:Membrane-tethered transcription factor n=1 Tax=Schizosaccharomyces octosporus (strain yFS286) TaxID=483514 RepID=S9Q6A2_SCHOY|nr:membrane-tethered transcription factor [Schizosaccharomyces octosporus yFS286]EPX75148.1 membrane-tethered transcription factor [Schizosaccharomyces octosporus yFS286]